MSLVLRAFQRQSRRLVETNVARVQLAWRISVSSTTVTVITPGAGCSLTPTATLSTAGATGRAAFFTGMRLGLALATARFAADFPRAAFDSFLALGRAFAPFRFWTFDDCFLRFAMVEPLVGAPDHKRQPAPSRDNPRRGLSTGDLELGVLIRDRAVAQTFVVIFAT
jgi:hypothetical protein